MFTEINVWFFRYLALLRGCFSSLFCFCYFLVGRLWLTWIVSLFWLFGLGFNSLLSFACYPWTLLAHLCLSFLLDCCVWISFFRFSFCGSWWFAGVFPGHPFFNPHNISWNQSPKKASLSLSSSSSHYPSSTTLSSTTSQITSSASQ